MHKKDVISHNLINLNNASSIQSNASSALHASLTYVGESQKSFIL